MKISYLAILVIGCLTLMFGSITLLKAIENSSNNVKSISLTLDDVYSKLDESHLALKLNAIELYDVIQMGGFLAIKNHGVALGGICQLPMQEASIFSDVFLEVTQVKPDEDMTGSDEALQEVSYHTDLTIKGDTHSINSNAMFFSEHASKSIRNSFDLIRDCHVNKASEGGISNLLAEQTTSPIVN